MRAITDSQKRKMTFLGNFITTNSIENLSLTGKVEGKVVRGRQRMTYLDNMKEWINIRNGNELIHAFLEREVWKRMIFDAIAHDT